MILRMLIIIMIIISKPRPRLQAQDAHARLPTLVCLRTSAIYVKLICPRSACLQSACFSFAHAAPLYINVAASNIAYTSL